MPKSPKPRKRPRAAKPAESPSASAEASRSTTRRAGRAWSPRTSEILGPWQPGSPQLELGLVASPLRLVSDATPAEAHAAPRSADDWYNAALDLEVTEPERAAAAYRSAIEAQPDHADAHLNLGRLLHEGGQLAEAEAHYRAAAAADATDALARFNLGVVLEDGGRREAALAAYREALRLDEHLASAHFNLSRLHESRGEKADALAHLAAYKRLLSAPRPPTS